MIQGVKLKWWLLLIAWGGLTISFGASLIDSVPFATVGGILTGWAVGGYTFHRAAVRAVEMLNRERGQRGG